MYTRRSGRLNPAYNSNQIQIQNQNQNPSPSPTPSPVKQNNNPSPTQQTQKPCSEAPQELRQERYFNSPEIEVIRLQEKSVQPEVNNPVTESPPKDVSATTKALNQLEVDGQEKKKWKKGGKIPASLRRKKLNKRLSKLLTPKSALILLQEFKPGCVYTVHELPGSFCAQVEHENLVLGTGQGLSKSQAKHSAAENAIKGIVSRTMSRNSKKTPPAPGEASKVEETEEDDDEDTPENLPWAGLASFAIYKMFSEWHNQGTDFMSMTRPATKTKAKAPKAVNPPKKELPPNAAELHPNVVLNLMYPGMTPVEIEREEGPKRQVKMGYMVEGQMYTGIGGNKKDAKKEAAKAVLQGHYGLTYH